MPTDEEFRNLAQHEAGHAVICRLLYGERVIKRISRRASQISEPAMSTYSRMPIPESCRPPTGVPRRGHPAPVSIDAIVDAYGVQSYAGMVAEVLRENSPSDSSAWMECARARVDRERLAKMASLVGRERPATRVFDAYWEEALRLLRSREAALERLGEALLQHEELRGDRVDALLDNRR